MALKSNSPIQIIIIGDTHALDFNEIPIGMLSAIRNADILIHIGDYTSKSVLRGLVRLKGEAFKGVYGNADPLSIRKEVSNRDTIEVLNKKIGITHPACGGSSKFTEKKAKEEFKEENLDVLVYGHTHDPKIIYSEEILIINPGKGYFEDISFGSQPSFVILTIDKEIKADLIDIAG